MCSTYKLRTKYEIIAMTVELKKQILRLLKEDEEFRYAVAGLIGLGEILRRLDRHEEQIVKIWERLAKIDEEIAKLREDMNRGFERHDKEFEKVWSEIAKLREEMIKGFERHDKEFEKIWSEIARLREDMIKGFERHDRELAKLREDFLKMVKRIDRIEVRLTRVERTLEHLTISIEEEAQEVVSRLLAQRGIQVNVSSISINKKYELDIYGSAENITVVGEAKVRASDRTIERFLKRIEKVKKSRPELFRGKVIPVLYCAKFLGDPSKAEERRVWLIVSGREVTRLSL